MIKEQIDCDLNHPIFSVIENDTRRQILRLIACEHNYGNRIASILGISTPAVHRHLKILEGEDDENLAIISESEKSNESYSGHKGAEAKLYKINKEIGVFVGIFPSFIHSQIFKIGENGQAKPFRVSQSEDDYFSYRPPIPDEDETEKETNKSRFYQLYQIVQDYNQQIVALQKKLMEVMHAKNKVMKDVDNVFISEEDLEYEDRVIIRAITCLGPECVSDLSEILNMPDVLIKQKIENILQKGLLEKRDI